MRVFKMKRHWGRPVRGWCRQPSRRMQRGVAPSGEPRLLPRHPVLTQGLFVYCSLDLEPPPAPSPPPLPVTWQTVHSLTPPFVWCLPLEAQQYTSVCSPQWLQGPAQHRAHCILNEHLNEELEIAVVTPFAQLSASPSAMKPQESTE